MIGEISALEIVAMLRQIEASGINETTRRVRSLCSRVFRYAIAIGFVERDPAADTVAAPVCAARRAAKFGLKPNHPLG